MKYVRFLLIIVSFSVCRNSLGDDRFEIAFFPYANLAGTDISIVPALFNRKRTTLIEEFRSPKDSQFEFLDKLSITPAAGPMPASNVDTHDLWKRGSFLALLMNGIVSKNMILSTQIYIGDLNGAFANRSILVSSDISSPTDEEFASIKDSHMIPTLFALAMQAKADKPQLPYVINSLLSKARTIAIDLGWNKVPANAAANNGGGSSKRSFYEAIEAELAKLASVKPVK